MSEELSTCTFEEFFAKYLPSADIEFDAIVEGLEQQKVLVQKGDSSRQKPSPSQNGSMFSSTFKSFKSLFKTRVVNPMRIVKAIQTIGSAIHEAVGKAVGCEPSEFSVRTQKILGHAAYGCVTTNIKGPVRPTDVMVPIMAISDDYHGQPDSDEDTLALSCAAQIMNSDARRIFCYGVTFDGPEVTMWRFTRSISLKSTPFDMTQRPDLLIRLLTSLLYSPASDLGHDPLITLLPDFNYVYEIPSASCTGSLYYKTVAPISDSAPRLVSGRRLRIWEVQQVESASNPVPIPGKSNRVLKDVFLDHTMRTEADIQEELFEDITKLTEDVNWRSRPLLQDFRQRDIDDLAEVLENGSFRQLFSCIVAKHIGETDPLDITEETEETNSNGLEDDPAGSYWKIIEPPPPRRPRRRCLFVYEHVCIPLNDIPSLGEAVDILRLVLIPLRLMFCAGWVHRDISPGNILAYRESPGSPWTVKLSDLEHAKRFPDPASTGAADSIIGTPYFIAYEISGRKHVYPMFQEYERDASHPVKPVPVVHCYQHDLESIWWILIWLITMRINQKLPRRFGAKHFTDKVGYGHASRRGALLTQGLAYDIDIHHSLPPVLQRSPFLIGLDRLRRHLYIGYSTRSWEAKWTDVSSYSLIASEGMNSFFDEVKASRAEWEDIELIVDSEPRPPTAHASGANKQHGKPVSNKREAGDLGGEGRVRKRARPNSTPAPAIVSGRTGPITRSMARNEGRITRSMTRRLQEEERQKKRR